jgi:hypothetical protein
VPNSVDLKQLIMDEFHRMPYVGHLSYQKMMTAVRQLYYWHGMKQDIARYILKCLECQQEKFKNRHPSGLLQPIQIPKWKWELISMDVVTCLPKKVKHHGVIMVVVDKFSKEAHFIPIKSTFKEIYISNVFMKEIFNLHDFPKTIISDRDTNFTSNF